MTKTIDILVVGGGPAGYSAAVHAKRAARFHEITVGLVESRQLGGTCLNRGCIPTKTLIETAGVLDRFTEASQRGIELSGTATLHVDKAWQYKDRIVKRMSAGVGVLLRENGVLRMNGLASVKQSGDADFPFAVSISAEGAETEELLARSVILATGAEPTRISILGMDDPAIAPLVFSSDDLLDFERTPVGIPEKLAILGGGVIGVETARIFRAFGSEVHLIEALPRLLPMLDIETAEAFKKSILQQKIQVTVGRKLQQVEPNGEGLSLILDDGQRIAASHLLVAVGRSPKTDMLAPELSRALEIDQRGFIPVDARMKTRVSGLFAPGDVNGKCMLAHAAIEMGRLAAQTAVEKLFPSPDQVDESSLEEYRRRIMQKHGESPLPDPDTDFFPFYVPGCVYGEPEIGYLGWTEEEARQKLGDVIRIGRFPFAANGRAASSGHRDGFVKVIRSRDDRIVGVHIIGPCASELINEAAVVLQTGGNVQRWAESIHAHPTYGEALVEATADSFGMALHLPPKTATTGRSS